MSGTLFICGGGILPQPIIERFVELAGGPKAKLIVIPTASEVADTPDVAYQLDRWRNANVTDVSLLHTRSREKANDPDFIKPLAEATGVWLGGGWQHRLTDAYLGTAVEKALHALLARGGVIGGTSSGAAVMSSIMIRQGRTVAEVGPGFGFIPGSVVDQHFIRRNRQQRLMGVLDSNPGLFGLGIDESTAVIVQGRKLTVIGDSQAMICLAECEQRPAKTQLLKPGDEADLVALSRAAIDRVRPMSAAAESPTPCVPHGTLVIVGGGGMPPEATERFIAAAGGPDAPLVVVTTAQGDTPPEETKSTAWLTKAGAKNVRTIHPRTPAEAQDPQVLAALRQAKGVWFGGGRQWRLVDAFLDTMAERMLHDVLQRGGVIGGSSAGATIQGSYLVRGNPLGNTEMMTEGYERGLGFLPGVAIDQHFTQRDRHADMLELKQSHPGLIGLGIDESTALIVRGREMEVVGKNQVAIYGRRPDAAADRPYQVVKAGECFDLERQMPVSMLAGKLEESGSATAKDRSDAGTENAPRKESATGN